MVEDITEGYKKTEIGIIPEEWDVSEVQDAYHICNNLRFPISEKVRKGMQGQYPYYGPTKIQDYINQYRLDGEYALIGEDGDHFLKWSTMPMTLLATGKFNVNNHAHVIKGTLNETKWFYWYFYNKDITSVLSRQGAGRYKLNKSTLQSIKMPIPSRDEQTAIANSLSDVVNLISSMEKLIVKKKYIKLGAMQKLLTGKERLSGFSGEWKETLLGSICNKITTGKLDANAMRENAQYRFYTCAKNYYWIDEYAFDDEALLVSGNGANVGYIHYYCGKFNAYQRTYVLTGFNNNNILFIKAYMEKYLSDRIAAEVNSGNTPYIKMDTLADMLIKLPPTIEEQTAIAEIITDMDTEIENLNKKLNKYKQIKQGMMQELLTGKRRLI